MCVRLCYRMTDNIKISKIQLSTTFPITVTVLFRSIDCFEIISYIFTLYINTLLHYKLSKFAIYPNDLLN